MTLVEVNNKKYPITNFGYHYQSMPWPGNGHYRMDIALTRNLAFFLKKEMHIKKITAKNLEKHKASFQSNLYPLFNAIVNFFLPKNTKFKIRWIMNNIEAISIHSNKLIIEGVCSRFIKDYKKPILR